MPQVCSKECPLAKGSGDETVMCAAKDKLYEALARHFKYSSFRPGQLDALLPVLHGYDVFVRMATGAGKSLCMFLAPLCMGDEAVGMIISPLNSLMEQQIAFLKDAGISAVRACDSIPDLLSEIAEGRYRFVFMAPETVMKPKWREVLQKDPLKDRLALVAVDEAHCILEWGKDFRTAFARLGGLRALTEAPFMALSASAPAETEQFLLQTLEMQEAVRVKRDLDRPNIYLSSSPMKGLNKDLGGLLSCLGSADPTAIPKTLIVTQTKAILCKIYALLAKSALKTHYVSMYHASLTKSTRTFVQSRFQSDTSELRVLVATVAFGMIRGVDIRDIERVVVYGVPDTVAELYQLCGRAGRGGVPSLAHLFYSPRQDISNPRLHQYCISTENCRRICMLEGVGSTEHPRRDICCDVCTDGVPYPRLAVPGQSSSSARKRRSAKHDLADSDLALLTKRLQEERDKIVEQHPAFRMIGCNFLLSNGTIAEICKEAKFASSSDDLQLYCVRPEFRDRICNVVLEVIANIPPPKRKRRT